MHTSVGKCPLQVQGEKWKKCRSKALWIAMMVLGNQIGFHEVARLHVGNEHSQEHANFKKCPSTPFGSPIRLSAKG